MKTIRRRRNFLPLKTRGDKERKGQKMSRQEPSPTRPGASRLSFRSHIGLQGWPPEGSSKNQLKKMNPKLTIQLATWPLQRSCWWCTRSRKGGQTLSWFGGWQFILEWKRALEWAENIISKCPEKTRKMVDQQNEVSFCNFCRFLNYNVNLYISGTDQLMSKSNTASSRN